MTISRWILRRERTDLDKSCRKNQREYFVFSNLCPKSRLFVRQCRKIFWGQRGRKWQYNRRMKFECRISKTTRAHAHMWRRPRKKARARTRSQKYIILTLFHGNNGLVNAPQCWATHCLSCWTLWNVKHATLDNKKYVTHDWKWHHI